MAADQVEPKREFAPAAEPHCEDSGVEHSAPVRPLGRDVWLTRDGRELRISEMYRPHLGNAQAILSKWIKVEKDPVKRRELKSWRTRMRRELIKREKAWRKKRRMEAL